MTAAGVAPGRDEFRALAAGGRLVPVHRDLPAGQETPVSAFLKTDDGAHSFLLESLEGGETWGRFSFVGSRPALLFVARGERCELIEDGVERALPGAPLEELDALLAARQAVALPGLPRFCGGAVGYLGHGATRWLGWRPAEDPAADAPPDAMFLFTDVTTVFDHVAHTMRVVTHARGGADPDAAWRAAVARLDAEAARLAAPLAWPGPVEAAAPPEPHCAFTPARFRAAVERARARARDEDVVQVTLARRLDAPAAMPAFELYRALRVTAPSPFGHFLRLGELCLCGAARGPLVRRSDDTIEAHPLAAERSRGRTAEEDRRLAEELLAGERVRAAHALGVDLARSDLGRVAVAGTVAVPDWLEVERGARTMRLAGTVRARPRPDVGALDVLRACFPAGEDTGLPRERAVALAAALEPAPRGIHGGAVGYLDLRGGLELCGTAGTVVHTGGHAHWSAGAVVTADTDPEVALRDAEDRSRVAWRALQRATGAGR